MIRTPPCCHRAIRLRIDTSLVHSVARATAIDSGVRQVNVCNFLFFRHPDLMYILKPTARARSHLDCRYLPPRYPLLSATWAVHSSTWCSRESARGTIFEVRNTSLKHDVSLQTAGLPRCSFALASVSRLASWRRALLSVLAQGALMRDPNARAARALPRARNSVRDKPGDRVTSRHGT